MPPAGNGLNQSARQAQQQCQRRRPYYRHHSRRATTATGRQTLWQGNAKQATWPCCCVSSAHQLSVMLARSTWLLSERLVATLFSGALTWAPRRRRCQVKSVPVVTPANRSNTGLLLLFGIQPQSTLTKGRHNKRPPDRKSTRLNSSHVRISYAVFCLKKKKTTN